MGDQRGEFSLWLAWFAGCLKNKKLQALHKGIIVVLLKFRISMETHKGFLEEIHDGAGFLLERLFHTLPSPVALKSVAELDSGGLHLLSIWASPLLSVAQSKT